MERNPTRFERLEKIANKRKKPTYSQKEIEYYLEILPLNRKSAILNAKKK